MLSNIQSNNTVSAQFELLPTNGSHPTTEVKPLDKLVDFFPSTAGKKIQFIFAQDDELSCAVCVSSESAS